MSALRQWLVEKPTHVSAVRYVIARQVLVDRVRELGGRGEAESSEPLDEGLAWPQ